MSLFDNCPLTTPLAGITKQACGQNYNQVQKIAIWQRGATPFTDVTILTSAAWATATAAIDDTKVIVTNYLQNFLIPNSTPVEVTSDTNINAVPELQRGSIVKGTFNSRSLSATQIAELQALTPYTQIQPGVTDLVFVMINNANQVIYNNNSGDLGFPIFNLFTSDVDIQAQLGALNMVASEFYLIYGWSKQMAIGQAAFDLLNTYPAQRMKTMVKLYSAELDEIKEHTLEHANNIFAYKHDHGWELKDENFTLNKHGIIVQRSPGKGNDTEKPGTTQHSGTA